MTPNAHDGDDDDTTADDDGTMIAAITIGWLVGVVTIWQIK